VSITYVEDFAFYGITSLTSITIPTSVINIGAWAFTGWRHSQAIYAEGHTEAPSGWDINWRQWSNANVVWLG